MTTFIWSVTSMPCYPQEDGKTDVVFEVFWNCTGSDVEGTDPDTAQSYVGSVNGSTNVPYVQGQPYTPYSQLTKEQVLNWIYAAGVNKDEIEAQVQVQIDSRKVPPVVTPPLPW